MPLLQGEARATSRPPPRRRARLKPRYPAKTVLRLPRSRTRSASSRDSSCPVRSRWARPKEKQPKKTVQECRITLAFSLGVTEASNDQWPTVMGGEPPSFWKKPDDQPVDTVSRDDAVAFCEKPSERLCPARPLRKLHGNHGTRRECPIRRPRPCRSDGARWTVRHGAPHWRSSVFKSPAVATGVCTVPSCDRVLS